MYRLCYDHMNKKRRRRENERNILIVSCNFSKELVPTIGAATTGTAHAQLCCFREMGRHTILGQNPRKRYLRHANILLLRNLLNALDNYTIYICCCVSRNRPATDFSCSSK